MAAGLGIDTGVQLGEHGPGGVTTVDTIIFNDGSKYTGTLKNGVPDGLGTCVWKDGNQYDGEWKNGLMHGFGTYLWTSGQRYDGEWKEGRREGVGVKLYADGSTFHGTWRDGKKNGVGVFKPAAKEKDRPRGPLRLGSGNLQPVPPVEGDSASNLRQYESVPETPRHLDALNLEFGAAGRPGPLEAGAAASDAGAPEAAPAGAGTEGEHDKDKDKEGREREKERRKEEEREREGKLLFIRAFEEGVLKREEKLSHEEGKMIFGQQQQAWEHRGSRARRKMKRALGFGKKLQQKHGQLLYKGMPGYNLMMRLQHGIRWSVGRGSYGKADTATGTAAAPVPPASPRPGSVASGGPTPLPLSHVLRARDFTEKVKVFFPSSGSSITPAHPSGDFKWKDYSPRVFRNLRNMYGIADADYMLSLGGSSALWQLNSPGKSGCMFFLSDDERFLVKTMRKTEIRTLIDMLPKYYSYMEKNPNNLVIRFFGVHGVKQLHGRTVRFVVMHNMFNTDLQMHRKFDLKGSTDGRTTGPGVDPNDPKTVFKDLDLDMQFLLEPAAHAALMSQLRSDADFLRDVAVMDYSLLLGIHFVDLGRQRLAEQQHAAAAAGQEGQPRRGSGAGNGVGEGGGAGEGRGRLAPLALESAASMEADELPSGHSRPSPPDRGAMLQLSPSSRTPGRSGGGAGTPGQGAGPGAGEDGCEGEHPRNFDLFTDRQDLDRQLALFEERMNRMGYSEQRRRDILDLARLRILGDKLKRRSKKAYKVYEGPSTVLKALASRRHGDAPSLPRVDEGEDGALGLGGGSDDEGPEGAPAARQPLLGRMRALAVHKAGSQPPEEVVLCFGIIDILQDWNARKILERTFKSLTHDSGAISVAPPKLYAARFADFLTHAVFIDPKEAAAKGLLPPPAAPVYSSGVYGSGIGHLSHAHSGGVVPRIEEEREGPHSP